MAKNNNKGFSLLEIVIAITILTLLLTPILRQLSQTMATNRKTKEQQYASENAEYVLQYLQSVNQDAFASSTDATAEIYPVSAKENVRQCEIYKLDPTTGNPERVYQTLSTEAVVDYNTYIYELNDIELGSRGTNYSRTAVLDDLSVKVSAFSDLDGDAYRISYNNTTAPEHFELTDEGCIVKYSTDADGVKYVSAIICEERAGSVSSDPNELNIGNMHDLDAGYMALINGYATEYDEQARNDLYLELMDLYKNSTVVSDNQRWEQEVNGANAISNSGYTNNIRKLTVLNIIKDTTGVSKCYRVSVDVVYEGNLTTSGGVTKFIHKEYTAWTQEFPIADIDDPCPEIYFEYQPFATSIDATYDEVTYATTDYLIINNQGKDAKIYLYKPALDQAIITYYGTNAETVVESLSNTDSYYVDNMYGVDPNHTTNYNRVDINIVSANAVNADNGFTIYTNLNIDEDKLATSTNPQFKFDNAAFSSYFQNYTVNSSGVEVGTPRSTSTIDISFIKSIDEEESKSNRLYTVTITLTPDDNGANTVTLTGAKGAN